MGSNSWVAPATLLCAAVLLGSFSGQCSGQASTPQTVAIGGDAGWSSTSNVNYTEWMTSVQFKAGDTLRFNNTGSVDLEVLQVYSQADYDLCNSSNVVGWTVNPGDFYDLPFVDPAYSVWLIDSTFCVGGLKATFMVLNADGTPAPADTGADPPSLNAPPASDYNSPPTPPSPPLSIAGGPTPNAASVSQAMWQTIAILGSGACYLASAF